MAGDTLLLDTHAFAWAVREPGRLSDGARTAIAEPSNVVLVSAASVWELATKFRLGQWPDVEPLVHDLVPVLERLRAKLWSITGIHAQRAGLLGWEHRDPFDRMLAAQALVDRLILVSRDRAFHDVPGLRVLW